MRSSAVVLTAALAVVGAMLVNCSSHSSSPAPPPANLTKDQLFDPYACSGCHSSQYQEWLGSMHAYAGRDPVFRAINKRMQRETGGAMGSLCVQCHAPLALRLGMTTDGLNLDELDQTAPKL